jgi:hypothetical protein
MSAYRRAMQRARRRAAANDPARVHPPPSGIDAGLVDDETRLEAVAEVALRCLLCGAPEAVRLIFTPKDQRRVGSPRGRTRLCRYSLCASCYRDPSSLRLAEERLLAGLDAMSRRN